MNQKFYYHMLRDDHLRSQVWNWWARLQGQDKTDGATASLRGVRAELRRCHTPDDVLLTEGFRSLWMAVNKEGARPSADMTAWATVAAVLADVRVNAEKPFAAALGSENEKTGKPHVSELRFSQLQKSSDSAEFLRRARRSVALLGRSASVLSLADSVLHWHKEKQGYYPVKPNHRLAVRWATDYFTELSRYQRTP
ncbi:type I-E CRISPR-associated protein Cse2/CasB [Hydrocarboniclastica marina]|uniref:Type I-E CRISPR-associated protein Cse2/CasB n=1 Tax=Hydrocarboniclastica marina TaxID=2259620 RepID=A0A4P7XLR0_9ALTE|nr:type I-E CRISPR-associated protein Cse2/CasB [Hydrocarboniclastica marina]QCF27514.1 type I-E CRISPR-associated protein Cse2/CasB [Hydrocarboniclastica marina]